MGTRCLTVMRNKLDQEIAVLYRQYDGYPEGHGNDLKKFLAPITLVNGLGHAASSVANGMDCLAAQIVSHFKQQAGDFYLMPAGTRDVGEDFVYTVYEKDKSIHLKVQAGCMTFFGMPGTTQAEMPVLYDGPAGAFDPAAAGTAEA